MTSPSRRWLVSGVSSGLGRALAELAVGRGDTVIGTVRRAADAARFGHLGPTALPVMVDLIEPETKVRGAVQHAIDEIGGLDVLVNNAGYGLIAAVEESSEDEARHQLETNFWGPWKLIRAALPALRAAQDARIVNVSSIAGFRGHASLGLYCASKFAIEGLSHSLRLELAELGVKVTIVEPGGFRTEWAGGGITTTSNAMAEYAHSTQPALSGIAAMSGHQPGDPRRAAEAIVALVEDPHPPLRQPLGTDAAVALKFALLKHTTDLDAGFALATSTDYEATADERPKQP